MLNVNCLSDQTKLCKQLNCSHDCRLTTKGPKCLCPPGYEPNGKDLTQCQDFDECSINAICDQKCKNTPGSYECSCVKGYSKSGNHCIAVNGKFLGLVVHFGFINDCFVGVS